MKKLLKSKIFWLVIVILVVGGGISAKVLTQKPKVEYITQEVIRGDIAQTVSATGQIKSASEIELNFKNSGKLSVLNIKVGDQVEEGQTLAQLRANDLSINVNRAKADLDEAIANLNRVQAGATSQDIAVSEASVEKANTDLLHAEINLENTKATYSQALENEKEGILIDINTSLTKANISLQEVYDTLNFEGDDSNFKTSQTFSLQRDVEQNYNDSIIKVDEAQLAYSLVELNNDDKSLDDAIAKCLVALNMTSVTLDNLSELLDYVIITSVLTRTDLDTLKTTINAERVTINTSLNTFQSSKQAISDARLNYQTKVNDSENAVEVASKNLAKSVADLNFKKAPARPEDTALYQARVKKSQADLQLAQDRYDETIIRAPIAGVITDINFNVGEQTSLSEPAITMLAEENYEVEVDIPESDIVKLSVGDETEITFDAFSDDDKFKGIVITINPAQTEIQDVVYYRVTVALPDDQSLDVTDLKDKIKPGMTANVTVKTAEIIDTLIIPLRAVKEENGKKIVQVLNAITQKTQDVEVTLGLKGDNGLVELKSGLDEGQLVVTFIRESK